MSSQGGAAGGGSAGGGSAGGVKNHQKSVWSASKTGALTQMIALFGLFFIAFRVDTDSGQDYTTIFILELNRTEWMSPFGDWKDPTTKLMTWRESKIKLRHHLSCRVFDMYQHPTNPKWIVVVTSRSVIIFEFDETSMSLKQICLLNGSDHDFQCIFSAHMGRDGRTLMLWTFNQVRKHEERHTHRGYFEVEQIGIKSHCVRFFRLSSTGSGCCLFPETTYVHPSMQSVEDHLYTGLMPRTYLSQDGSLMFIIFRTNIIVSDLGSHSLIHIFDMNTIPDVFQFDQWGRIRDFQSMTVVSNQPNHYLVLLSSKGLITILKFDSDHPEQGLEFKSRYESPKNIAECSSIDLSTYHCLASSSHEPLNFFVGGSTCGSGDGVIRLYKIDGSTGEICLLSEEKAQLAVYEIKSKNGVTCALSKHCSGDSAYLHSLSNSGGITPVPCHMILDTMGNPPPPSQSTLNGAPIGLPLGGVFAVLSDGAIVASNSDKGLTLFGPDGKPVVSTTSKDAHQLPITSVFSLEVVGNTFVVSFSHSDGSIKIWSIQKRGETVHIRIVATISTADLVLKEGVKFLALYGQTLLIVTNQQKILRFRVEIAGIRAEIRPIPGPVVQMEAGQICQGIAAVSPTYALIYVAISGVRGCSLVLVSFVEGAAEMFKPIGTRDAGKSPAVLTPNGFAVSAVVPTTVCSTALAPGGVSFSFPAMEMTINSSGKKAVATATILALASCEGGFIYITEKGSLFRITYSDEKSVVPKKIADLKCALTPKCRLQVSGNTVMVCQPRDDGSFELQTFQF